MISTKRTNTHNINISLLRRVIADKEYYTKLFMNEILPAIAKISNQPKYGYHGLTHTTQVAMFGIDLALAENTAPLPVLLAAGLHDCARTHDGDCPLHGPRCVPIAREFIAAYYPSIPRNVVEQIVYAVKNHSGNVAAGDAVSACLWDADRIRLAWELGYDAKFFSTDYGRRLASLTPAAQHEYIARQERFLISHNIRTRARIEYDREMDAIQCALGTNFKTR